ncbi:hypothetical protein MTO96_052191 [Rhipicephalus appendiculatus]
MPFPTSYDSTNIYTGVALRESPSGHHGGACGPRCSPPCNPLCATRVWAGRWCRPAVALPSQPLGWPLPTTALFLATTGCNNCVIWTAWHRPDAQPRTLKWCQRFELA